MAQNGNGAHKDILSLLSPERRAEIITEALSGAIHHLLADNAEKTVGEVVDALQAHPNWDDLKAVPATLLFGGATAQRAIGRATTKTQQQPAKFGEAKAPGAKHDGRGAVQRVVEAIKAGNNVRGVDIMKTTGLPQKVVTKTLEKLRLQKAIKGRGHGRGMMYTFVG